MPGLPPGLTANKTQEVSEQIEGLEVSGTPTQAGYYYITATATDSENPPQTATIRFEIQIDPPTWSIVIALPNGKVGVPYSAPVTITGGVTAKWSAQELPPGFTINPSTGVISGVPTAVFDQTITVYATVTQPVTGTVTKWESGSLIIDPA